MKRVSDMDLNEQLPPLSEAQTEIMNVVWERGELTLTQICDALTSSRVLARTTIQTQIARLVEKGWLAHRSVGKAFYYRPTVNRADARSQAVEKVVASIFGGSAEGMVLTLLDGRKLTREEANRIRKAIEVAEEDR
jgi:predicted transcriptional regulator